MTDEIREDAASRPDQEGHNDPARVAGQPAVDPVTDGPSPATGEPGAQSVTEDPATAEEQTRAGATGEPVLGDVDSGGAAAPGASVSGGADGTAAQRGSAPGAADGAAAHEGTAPGGIGGAEAKTKSSESLEQDIPSVRPVDFGNLEQSAKPDDRSNIDLLLDVKLPVAVELGRTEVEVKEILDFGPGSIIELSKEANEPVDLLVNGVLVARGEVVVVDDCFGIRLSALVSPEERIRILGGAA